MNQEYHPRILQLEARVSQLEAIIQALLLQMGIDPANLTPQAPQETRAVLEALLSGDKIKAIKIYRTIYGAGLKEAKDAVDAMERALRS